MLQIAPGFDTGDWKSLRLDDLYSADWERALGIFHGRIIGRFVEPVDKLIELEEPVPAQHRRFGFTIMAIDCLLVETLGAFLNGLLDTEGKSAPIFCDFLLSRPLFAAHFSPATAKDFYKVFRCGILHQAEVGGRSLIKSWGPAVKFEPGKMTVNRTAFHALLKREIASYEAELRDPKNDLLRSNFRTKMDFICSR